MYVYLAISYTQGYVPYNSIQDRNSLSQTHTHTGLEKLNSILHIQLIAYNAKYLGQARMNRTEQKVLYIAPQFHRPHNVHLTIHTHIHVNAPGSITSLCNTHQKVESSLNHVPTHNIHYASVGGELNHVPTHNTQHTGREPTNTQEESLLNHAPIHTTYNMHHQAESGSITSIHKTPVGGEPAQSRGNT